MTLGRTSGLFGRRGGRGRALKAAGAIATVAGLVALTACGSSSGGGTTLSGLTGAGMYGSLPAASGTAHSGMLKVALLGGSAPTEIYPLTTAAADSVYNEYDFDYQLYRPLYWYPSGTNEVEDKSLSLANDPTYSDNDTQVSITLKDFKWSDGQTITSADVAFYLYQLEAAIKLSPANWDIYSPGTSMPDIIKSISTPDSKTIDITLTKSVNPSWFTEDELSNVFPEPVHAWAKTSGTGAIASDSQLSNLTLETKIYNYLIGQSKLTGTWSTNPLWQVVDGPYKLTSFNATTGDYTMVPNTGYSGPHANPESPWEALTYTSDSAEFTALKSGAVDLGWIPMDNVPEAKTVANNYYEWGYPGAGWQGIILNYKDSTGDFGNIISQLYIRQALQELVDQNGILKAYLHGAGSTGYGPVGEYPTSPYTPADAKNPLYAYSTTNAANLLKAHGWSVVPGGTDSCQKPGTASDECGAGIPAGTKLAWPLAYASEVVIGEEMDTALASAARSVGIEITLSATTFNSLIQNDNDVAVPQNENKWAMSDFGGFTNNTYPTTEGLFNSGAGENMGDYDSATANSLIDQSISGSNPTAVENEVSYLTQNLPVIFQDNPDWDGADAGILAISKQISGNPSYFSNYAEYVLTPEFWYFKK
jgi:peptide/nickel transport system substrate-binding protein